MGFSAHRGSEWVTVRPAAAAAAIRSWINRGLQVVNGRLRRESCRGSLSLNHLLTALLAAVIAGEKSSQLGPQPRPSCSLLSLSLAAGMIIQAT
jgi:hypothetical protein